MKSKDLQNIVLSRHQQDDTPTEIYRHLNGGISLATIKRWYQMIRQSVSIRLLGIRAPPRIVKTLKRIDKKLKTTCAENRRYQVRKLSRGGSATSIRRRLKIDLEFKPYKKIIEPSLSNDQKIKRKQFANWLRTNFRKEDTLRILFSDEKFFDIDGVYNSENERVWTINRADADEGEVVSCRNKSSPRENNGVVGCLLHGSHTLGDLGWRN